MELDDIPMGSLVLFCTYIFRSLPEVLQVRVSDK